MKNPYKISVDIAFDGCYYNTVPVYGGVKWMARDLSKNSSHVIGVKQVGKAVRRGKVSVVYVADDAEGRVLDSLVKLCREQGVELKHAATMKELGKTCGIEVGAAAAALLRDNVC